MITTFRVILIIFMLISFLFVSSDKEEKENKTNLTLICISSIAAFCLTFMF